MARRIYRGRSLNQPTGRTQRIRRGSSSSSTPSIGWRTRKIHAGGEDPNRSLRYRSAQIYESGEDPNYTLRYQSFLIHGSGEIGNTPQFWWERIEWPELNWPDLPDIKLPSIEMPTIHWPHITLPRLPDVGSFLRRRRRALGILAAIALVAIVFASGIPGQILSSAGQTLGSIQLPSLPVAPPPEQPSPLPSSPLPPSPTPTTTLEEEPSPEPSPTLPPGQTPSPRPSPLSSLPSGGYDDFSANTLDSNKWQIANFSGPECHIEAQSGAVVFSNELADEGLSCHLLLEPGQQVPFEALSSIEADFYAEGDSAGTYEHIGIDLFTDDVEGGAWFAQCGLGWANGINYLKFINVDNWGTSPGELEFYSYFNEGVTAKEWHTIRLEVVPSTTEFRCFFDGVLIDSYVPDDADQLAEAKYRLSLFTYHDPNTAGTFMADNVRIGVPLSGGRDSNTSAAPADTPIPSPTNTAQPSPPTATSIPPTPVPPSPVPGPSASLISVEQYAECKWAVRMQLSGFAPNSAVTVSSSYSEIECATGNRITASWSQQYGTTDGTGNLIVAYTHQGTGEYHYTFTDGASNQAQLDFTTAP